MGQSIRLLTKLLVLIFIFTFSATSFAADFGEEDLKKLIKKSKVTSLEQLLPLLPKEFVQNFTFVYDSRSPFNGSITPDYPRVILFSPDGKFVITFTGAPDKPGYDIIETIEFDKKSDRFKFYAYDFANPNKPNPDLTPESCRHCHGSDPRPIYDSYPLWPGFYGATLDSFPKDIVTSTLELKNYKNFLSTNAKKGLYKYLEFQEGSSVSPYLEPDKLALDEKNQAINLEIKFKPNERFGIVLTALNKKRIFRKIKKSPQYEKVKKELLYELLDCGVSQIKEDRIKKVDSLVKKENIERIKRMKALGRDNFNKLLHMQERLFSKQLAQVDWLAEKLNISMDDWSLAMENGSFSFFDGILSGIYENKVFYMKEDIIFEALKELAQKEKKYSPFFKVSYTLETYNMPFIDKISWSDATKSCPVLAKDLKI